MWAYGHTENTHKEFVEREKYVEEKFGNKWSNCFLCFGSEIKWQSNIRSDPLFDGRNKVVAINNEFWMFLLNLNEIEITQEFHVTNLQTLCIDNFEASIRNGLLFLIFNQQIYYFFYVVVFFVRLNMRWWMKIVSMMITKRLWFFEKIQSISSSLSSSLLSDQKYILCAYGIDEDDE